jgi:CysZ protein
MIQAVNLALADLLSPPFRGVLLKSVALTLGLLIALWAVLTWLAAYAVTLPNYWLDTAFSILTGAGLVIGLGFLVAPVTALFAGLFLDEIAEVVERTRYPDEPAGRPLPTLSALVTSLKFLGVVLLVNAIALPLVLFVGFGLIVFLVANAYLLGREYFDLAAIRFHRAEAVGGVRARHSAKIFAAGLVIAGFVAIPVVNLLAPLFATALMVHLHRRIEAAERRQ